jgi:hypothetical protein
VIISNALFDEGTQYLLEVLNNLGPPTHSLFGKRDTETIAVNVRDWQKYKEAIRNYIYKNFNPGLLPQEHPFRRDVFAKIASTAALFLALEPQVFVSRIRCRIFKNWKAAEGYYANSLNQLKRQFAGMRDVEPEDVDDTEFVEPAAAAG